MTAKQSITVRYKVYPPVLGPGYFRKNEDEADNFYHDEIITLRIGDGEHCFSVGAYYWPDGSEDEHWLDAEAEDVAEVSPEDTSDWDEFALELKSCDYCKDDGEYDYFRLAKRAAFEIGRPEPVIDVEAFADEMQTCVRELLESKLDVCILDSNWALYLRHGEWWWESFAGQPHVNCYDDKPRRVSAIYVLEAGDYDATSEYLEGIEEELDDAEKTSTIIEHWMSDEYEQDHFADAVRTYFGVVE